MLENWEKNCEIFYITQLNNTKNKNLDTKVHLQSMMNEQTWKTNVLISLNLMFVEFSKIIVTKCNMREMFISNDNIDTNNAWHSIYLGYKDMKMVSHYLIVIHICSNGTGLITIPPRKRLSPTRQVLFHY